MRKYEVTIEDDKIIVTTINGNKTSIIIIPTSERERLESVIEELLQYAYLDGKMDGRHARQS